MERLYRLNIQLRRVIVSKLREEAMRRHISVAHLIREIIDAYFGDNV